MTDREMLLMAYGAMKVTASDGDTLSLVVTLVEEHLFPQEQDDKGEETL